MAGFKKPLPFLFPILALATLLSMERPFQPYASGAPGGHTGSPGDGGITCARGGCHSSYSPVYDAPNVSISTDIPSQGYRPDSTYTVTAKIKKGGNTFGFEATVEDSNDQKIGDPQITQGNSTQLTNNGNAVTHTSNGNGGSGSRTWEFEWKAPSTGVGPITFYAAFNEANGNGNPTGDSIELTQLQIPMDSTWMQLQQRSRGNTFSLQPNPVRSDFRIKGKPSFSGTGRLVLYDQQGRLLRTLYQGRIKELSGKRFSLPGGIAPGIYSVRLKGEEGVVVEKMLVK